MYGMRRMRQPHDKTVVGFRRDFEWLRQVLALNNERVVARRKERAVDAAEYRAALMADDRALAVHRDGCTRDGAAIYFADRLMAKAHTEDRHLAARVLDQIEADPSLMRGARPRRQHDRIGGRVKHIRDAHLVVPVHVDTRALRPEIMNEVEGKTVIVVDQGDVELRHGSAAEVKPRFSAHRTAKSNRRAIVPCHQRDRITPAVLGVA